MKGKRLLLLFLPIVLLTAPLLAGEVVPRFVFYSSVVEDPRHSVENLDGLFTVKVPVTTATPVTRTGELPYPTFDILKDTLTYPTFTIEPVQLSYPTFEIEPVQLPYPTYDLQKDTLTYPTFHIEPVTLPYPTYDLVDDALTCNSFDLVEETLTCNTFHLTTEPKCQDVPYLAYEVATETVQVPYRYSYAAYVFERSECLDGVILGIATQCPEGGSKDNCCKLDGGSGNWTCYGFNPFSEGTGFCYPVYTEVTIDKEVLIPVEVPKVTEVTRFMNVCMDTVAALPATYPVPYKRAVPTVTPLPYKKAVPSTGTLESIRATPITGTLETVKAVPTTGSLDGIKATETTGMLDAVKATPATGMLETIKAVPKTEVATYEYSTFEVTEEEKLIDVYVNVPQDVDPPAMVTDAFVGTLGLEAKAWFFTRPKGGDYITDIRVVRITGGNGTPVKREVLEAWDDINKVRKTYAGSERVELSRFDPTDQAGQIRIFFKAVAPNGDYRRRKVFINVWNTEDPEGNAPLVATLGSSEEEE